MSKNISLFGLLLTCLGAGASSLPPHVQSFVKAYAVERSGVIEGPALKAFNDESSPDYSQVLADFVGKMVKEFGRPAAGVLTVSSYLQANPSPGVARWSSLLIMVNRFYDEHFSRLELLTGLRPEQMRRSRRLLIAFYADLVTAESVPFVPESVATLLILNAMNVGQDNQLKISRALSTLQEKHSGSVGEIQGLWRDAETTSCPENLTAPQDPDPVGDSSRDK